MPSKEEIAAAAKALADQLLELAAKEQARDEFNKFMLSAQELLLMDDRLTADPNRGPDEYPDTLAPLFQVIYTGPEEPNIENGLVEILEDGITVGTFNAETDVLPDPIPLPTGEGTALTVEELAEIIPPTTDPEV